MADSSDWPAYVAATRTAIQSGKLSERKEALDELAVIAKKRTSSRVRLPSPLFSTTLTSVSKQLRLSRRRSRIS
jgi:hypothetical protein